MNRYKPFVFASLAAALLCSVPGLTHAQTPPTRLKSFGFPPTFVGNGPRGNLTDGGDGFLYGVTSSGGTNNQGTVYRVKKDGTGYTNLWSHRPAEGAAPQGTLLLGQDGALYGTTLNNGINNGGNLFRINRDGSGFTNFFMFNKLNLATEPRQPSGGLIQGPDGILYGTTTLGGASTNFGVVFKVSTNGSNFTVLSHLGLTIMDPRSPSSVLLLAADGALYGTTSGGGTNNAGTAFRLNTDGSGFTNLYNFKSSGTEGRIPGPLIQGLDGRLYAGCNFGGASSVGAIVRFNTDGTGFTNVYSFRTIANDGRQANGLLAQGADGAIYGTAVTGGGFGLGSVFRINADGTGFTNLYSFQAGGDALNPSQGILLDPTGTLFGVTASGGSNNLGTAFRVSTNGTAYSVLVQFTGPSNGDAIIPNTGLLQGSDGALYGTTSTGGRYNVGTIFKIQRNGTGYTNIYQFKGSFFLGQTFNDGANPNGCVIEGLDGALYGTTGGGGTSSAGIVFRIGKDGSNYSAVYHFKTVGTELRSARNALFQFTNGSLYGFCTSGGASNLGGIFRVETNGTSFTNLHSFLGTAAQDGNNALCALINGGDGFLYGTAANGGLTNFGTIFRLSADGSTFTNIYFFKGGASDVSLPNWGLTRANDGMLYGLGQSSGSNGFGGLYRIAPDGSGYTNLSYFRSGTFDPRVISSPVFQGTDGYLYAATVSGGTNAAGAIVRFTTNGVGPLLITSFRTGSTGEGAGPQGPMVQGPDGSLYGVANGAGEFGFGTVWSLPLSAPAGITVPVQNLWGECNARSNLTFGAVYVGTPPFQFQWYFNGAPISGATNPTFTVLSSTQQNVGTYAVAITNGFGQTNSSGSVIGFRDTLGPTFTVFGLNPHIISVGTPYVEPGAISSDVCTGPIPNLTTNIVVNTNIPGTYTVTYSAIDSSGNIGMASRSVWITYRDTPVTTTAPLGGVVNPNGVETYVMFQYGLTTAYGLNTAWVTYAAGAPLQQIRFPLEGLTRNATYHYRQVTSNSLGVVTFGLDQSLTTNWNLRPGDDDGDNAVSLQELNQVLQRYRNLAP